MTKRFDFDERHEKYVMSHRWTHFLFFAELPITNLDWLPEGENRFGPNHENVIVLPANCVRDVVGSVFVLSDHGESIADGD
jgi:hypothetical protein